MKSEVEALIKTAVAMDPSITPEMTDAALAVLRGESPAKPPSEPEILTPIVTIKETTKLLRVTRVTVNNMLNRKILVRVYGSSADRAIGISRESVLKAMRGDIDRRHKKRRRT